MKKRFILLSVLLSFVSISSYGQSVYMGLEADSNVQEPQSEAINGNFWPEFQIIDSLIYVPTKNGVFRKHLNSLSDTVWSPYAFQGISIKDFVKNDDQILGLTNHINDSLLVYSNDNGISYTYKADTHFQYTDLDNSINQIAHNSPSLGKILVVHGYGISLSLDTGNTWSLLSDYAPGYQYRFIDFHPGNDEKIYSTGEEGFYTSYVYTSFDGGNSWSNLNSVQNNCTHVLAFHPTNEDIYLIGGEGRITKSDDAGVNWSSFDLSPYLYIYEIKYDLNDPEIVYAAGAINGPNDTIYFLKSTDAGDNWEIAYQEEFSGGDTGGILDFEIVDGQIIYLTGRRGMFYLNTLALSTGDVVQGDELDVRISPNPTSDRLKIFCEQRINSIAIYNNPGRLIQSYSVNSNEFDLSLGSFEAGVYYVTIQTKDHQITRKVLKY